MVRKKYFHDEVRELFNPATKEHQPQVCLTISCLDVRSRFVTGADISQDLICWFAKKC
jgi:hypothetical protein